MAGLRDPERPRMSLRRSPADPHVGELANGQANLLHCHGLSKPRPSRPRRRQEHLLFGRGHIVLLVPLRSSTSCGPRRGGPGLTRVGSAEPEEVDK